VALGIFLICASKTKSTNTDPNITTPINAKTDKSGKIGFTLPLVKVPKISIIPMIGRSN